MRSKIIFSEPIADYLKAQTTFSVIIMAAIAAEHFFDMNNDLLQKLYRKAALTRNQQNRVTADLSGLIIGLFSLV